MPHLKIYFLIIILFLTATPVSSTNRLQQSSNAWHYDLDDNGMINFQDFLLLVTHYDTWYNFAFFLEFVQHFGMDAPKPTPNYRQDMRDFMGNISTYAKNLNPNFFLIAQNGHSLLLKGATPATAYLNAIDGIAQESLFFGYPTDNRATSPQITQELIALLNIAQNHTLPVLVTDYCSTPSNVDVAHAQNQNQGYISFPAHRRDLDGIPPYPTTPFNTHTDTIHTLSDMRNFLLLLNPGQFANKQAYLNALRNTNYDVLILDLFWGTTPLSPEEVQSLKIKANGGKRLVIAYLSIGEAEDYRYYWQKNWATSPPSWLHAENPNWSGNYKVKYWDKEWQNIIYGTQDAYLGKIIDASFDGIYMDIIDAFEYFENLE